MANAGENWFRGLVSRLYLQTTFASRILYSNTVRVVMPPNISDENSVYKRQQSRTSSSDDKYVFP